MLSVFVEDTFAWRGGATTEAGRARAAELHSQAELIHDLLAFAPSHATLTDALVQRSDIQFLF